MLNRDGRSATALWDSDRSVRDFRSGSRVAAERRPDRELIKDVIINHGNHGGPLFLDRACPCSRMTAPLTKSAAVQSTLEYSRDS